MKKILFILWLLFSSGMYSQFVTVTPSAALQMAESITNPRCITITGTPIIKSGSNYPGNPNSVGTFSAGAGSTFPISKGIVLSTGSLNKIPGPKNLPFYAGDGNTAWPGDPDMNTNLGQSNFVNASSLEFNFTSKKNSLKFNFVFSSEEYGNNQCSTFADDAMVILLTDLISGATINIASVPSNISVNNIRKAVNNPTPGCGDSNPTYFGTIYNNLNGPSAPINFLGSTVGISASTSTLIVGRPYKLKIVIADRLTEGYDSAVFIGKYQDYVPPGSLLGPDLVAGTSVCEGTPTTLTANITLPTTFIQWKRDDVILPGQSSPTLNISAADAVGNHIYTISYLTSVCGNFDGEYDSIKVNFIPPTTTDNPVTLNKCVSGLSYNLSENTTIISAGLAFIPTITYHTDAACATPALPINYTGAATTIYVKISKPGTPACPIIKSFLLNTIPDPVAIAPLPQHECARNPGGTDSNFTLASLNATILGSQSSALYGVSYHKTLSGATSNNNFYSVNPLNGNGVLNNGPVFIRVYVKTNQNCFDASQSFIFTVDPKLAADKPVNVVYCQTGYKLPTLTSGKYFTNAYIAGNATSQLPEIPAGTVILTTKTIYISNLRDASALPCSQENKLTITIIKDSDFTVTDKITCDKFPLPALTNGNYFTGPNGTGTQITEVVNTTNATTVTKVYFFFQSTINTTENPQCVVNAGNTFATITLQVQPKLSLLTLPNIFTCNPPYQLSTTTSLGHPNAKYYNGPNGTGGEITNLFIDASAPGVATKKDIYLYEEGTESERCPAQRQFTIYIGLDVIAPVSSCNYTLPDLSPGQYWSGQGGTGQRYYPGDNIAVSGDYYLYVPVTGGCTPPFKNEVPFRVDVSHPPVDNLTYQVLDLAGAYEQISNIDVINTALPFTVTNPEIVTCGEFKLKPIARGRYYTESYKVNPTRGTELFANDIITASATSATTSIFVYAESLQGGAICPWEVEYKFRILEKPVLVPITANLDPCTDSPFPVPTLAPGEAYYTAKKGTINRQLFTATTLQGPSINTLYIYKENPTDPSCYTETSLKIAINPLVALPPPANALEERCVSYTLPTPTVTGSFYYDYSNLPLLTDPFGTELTNLNLTIPSGTILPYYEKQLYIYKGIFDGTRKTNCQDEEPLKVVLYKQPSIDIIPDLYFCRTQADVTGADLPTITGTNLKVPDDLVTKAKYFNGAGGTGGEITLTTVLTNGQIVYAYAKNPSIVPGSTFTGCSDEKSFKVNIFKLPIVNIADSCGNIALSDLPALTIGNYFTSAGGINPLTANDLVNTGTTTITKTIYVYGISNFPSGKCQYDEYSQTVDITPIPVTNPVLLADRTFCDTDTVNDGTFLISNLSIFDTAIKGTQTNAVYSVTYHATLQDALLTTNYTAITATNLKKVFAVVRNSISTICSSVPYELNFIINFRPIPTPTDKFLCVDNITYLAALGDKAILDTNLPAAGNTFAWYDTAGVLLPTETGSTLITGNTGTYSVIVTSANGCASNRTFAKIIPSSKPIASYTVTQNFEDNQTIVVIATGAASDFEYQLDGNPFQDSNVFENLYDGEHTIVVRDKNGCGDSDKIEALIINYPKFFTPNGDNFNDTWNIIGLKEQQNAKITIYDRHGKLIKQISPKGEGWDGRFNGSELPSSDYWFTVRYLEYGITKEFKSHFAMKR